MNISQWLKDKLEFYKNHITVLGVVSSVFTILGVSMPLNADFFTLTSISILKLAAIFNTIITFFVIRWGLKTKRDSKLSKENAEKRATDSRILIESVMNRDREQFNEQICDFVIICKKLKDTTNDQALSAEVEKVLRKYGYET